jgi:hypothetical protein
MPSDRIKQTAAHKVYVRKRGESMPPVDGSLAGWTLDEHLVCRAVRHEAGVRGPTAELEFIPKSAGQIGVEVALTNYHIDDQVKVTVVDGDDELVLFEGVLVRHVAAINADESGSTEQVTFHARSLAELDNIHPQKIIRGPWFTEDRTVTPEVADAVIVIETPLLPAVFNFRGLPNRQELATLTWKAPEEGEPLLAFAFDDSHFPAAAKWRVADAISSLLAMWLFGAAGAEHDRHIDLDPALLAELAAPAGPWAEELPELPVHGMGVLDAIARVCQVAGLEMSILPVQTEDPTEEGVDRRFMLRIWRTGEGETVSLDLGQRGTTYLTAQECLDANNLTAFNAVADGAGIVNTVLGAAPVFIEALFPLRPMWDPDDVFAGDAVHSDDLEEEDLLDDTTYAGRHVAQGVAFHLYGRVGRAWGLDCTGQLSADFYPDSDELYHHPPEGFDFLAWLGIEAGHPIVAEREAAGITDPIQWVKRVRLALPLKSEYARVRGVKYVLEVSEDGGTTWKPLKGVTFTSMADQFGIVLNIRNLADVNWQSLSVGEDEVEDVDPNGDSWWKLIVDKQLTFRLNCAIECDHAVRRHEGPASGTATGYERGQYQAMDGEEVWIEPLVTAFGSDFTQYTKLTDGARDIGAQLESAVKRRRDAFEHLRISGTASIWPLDFERYQVGYRINGIAGRGMGFGLDGSVGERFPAVVGITYRLSPSGAQAIELTLGDQRLVGAR